MKTSGSPHSRGRWPAAVLAAAAAVFYSGCASTYDMKVDSLSSPQLDHAASYRIVNRNPLVEADSLRYKEVEKAVKTALSGKGMYEASDPEKAEVVVYLDYGIKPPRIVEEVHSEPVYNTTPGQLHSELVQIGTDRLGNPIFATVLTRDAPTTEYAGNEDYIVPVAVYEKYLRLSARENKPAAEGKAPSEVWSVDVTSEGPSDNLRKYIPIMAAATIGYIGKDTSGEKSVRLKDDKDGDVAFVKKGM
jgi:hypothetical protein